MDENQVGTEGQTETATKGKVEKELKIIRMTDGRDVEFPGKRKLQKTPIADERGIGVKLDFVNGETRDFIVPADLLHKFAVHGAEQKLGDEIAGVDDIDDCVLAIDELIDRLYEGNWGAKREVNAMAGASILAKALVETSGKTLDEVRHFLKDKSQAQKVALRANAKIAPVIQRLEAEKAEKSKRKPQNPVDTDSLLDALANGPVALPTSTEGAVSDTGTEGTTETVELT